MLKGLSFINMMVWNLFIIGMWHIIVFLACVKLPKSVYDPSKSCFSAKQWEHGGRWYKENLKIHLWKDRLPQHIGRGGFSKQHLTDVSIDYLDQFILETCRGEWMHIRNCFCVVAVLLVNPLLVGITASIFILVGNLPFAIVQRYNRFRLQVLRKRRLRELRQDSLEQNTVTA